MRRGGQKSRRVLWAQDSHRMRVEGNDHRSAADSLCIPQGPFNHGPVSEMEAVEDANREDQRAGNRAEFFDGVERFQSGGLTIARGNRVKPHWNRSSSSNQAPRKRETSGRLMTLETSSSRGLFLKSSTVIERERSKRPERVRRSIFK